MDFDANICCVVLVLSYHQEISCSVGVFDLCMISWMTSRPYGGLGELKHHSSLPSTKYSALAHCDLTPFICESLGEAKLQLRLAQVILHNSGTLLSSIGLSRPKDVGVLELCSWRRGELESDQTPPGELTATLTIAIPRHHDAPRTRSLRGQRSARRRPQSTPVTTSSPAQPRRLTSPRSLSRPSLAEQQILPTDPRSTDAAFTTADAQSHAYPPYIQNDPFSLTPLLTLPPQFGSVFIGETFSCILSASSSTDLPITEFTITAEIQTPSQTISLPISAEPAIDLAPGTNVQRIATYDLKEEGAHVLSVTVSYTHQDTPRTFRKLYQFAAQHCIVVRTKTGLLEGGGKGRAKALLEAQLENMAEASVVLESVVVATKGGWEATGLNWGEGETPILRNRDVMQVAFLMEREEVVGTEPGMLGSLALAWRTAGGDKGFLKTGKLVVAL